jgi:HD-GYP domain-containing protein (c-di-GMP phosphodiesterase class II)
MINELDNRLYMEQSPVPLLIIDSKRGMVQFCNSAAIDLLGDVHEKSIYFIFSSLSINQINDSPETIQTYIHQLKDSQLLLSVYKKEQAHFISISLLKTDISLPNNPAFTTPKTSFPAQSITFSSDDTIINLLDEMSDIHDAESLLHLIQREVLAILNIHFTSVSLVKILPFEKKARLLSKVYDKSVKDNQKIFKNSVIPLSENTYEIVGQLLKDKNNIIINTCMNYDGVSCELDSIHRLPLAFIISIQEDIHSTVRIYFTHAGDFYALMLSNITAIDSLPTDPAVLQKLSRLVAVIKNSIISHYTIEQATKLVKEEENIIIFVLTDIISRMAEKRDNETGNHIQRVQLISKIIIEEIVKKNFINVDILTGEKKYFRMMSIERLANSVMLHDLGKIAIEDSILLKPGKLESDEFAVMKTHTSEGEDLVSGIMQKYSKELADKDNITMYLTLIKDVTIGHHEKWDGTGYPHNKKGKNIPLIARITAICDVYDALRSNRPYKKSWDVKKTLALFKEEKGKHFDPKLVDIMFKHIDEFEAIQTKYQD